MGRVAQLAGVKGLCIKVCVGGSGVRTCACASPITHAIDPTCQKAEALVASERRLTKEVSHRINARLQAWGSPVLTLH